LAGCARENCTASALAIHAVAIEIRSSASIPHVSEPTDQKHVNWRGWAHGLTVVWTVANADDVLIQRLAALIATGPHDCSNAVAVF
jgi:hypothetical protein